MTQTNQRLRLSNTAVKVALIGLMLIVATGSITVAEPSPPSATRTEESEDWRSHFTQLFRRKPPMQETPGTSRGEFCLLSPGELFEQGAEALWEQRPTLIWTGRLAKVAVQEVGASEPLWHHSVPFNSNRELTELQVVRYSGPVLEASKHYEWQAFERESDSAPQQVRPFSILEQKLRGPITRAWMQEQVKLVQAGAMPEEQALRRGEFLLEQELSADFYQALFLAAVRGQLDREGIAIVGELMGEQCSN